MIAATQHQKLKAAKRTGSVETKSDFAFGVFFRYEPVQQKGNYGQAALIKVIRSL